MKISSTVHFILSSLWVFRWWICIQFFILFIAAIDVNLRPFLLKIILDRLASCSAVNIVETLIVPSITYVLMSLGVVIIFRIYDFVWLTINSGLKHYIGNTVMKRMMQHSPALFQDYFAGNLANRIKDVMSGIPDFLKLLGWFFTHLCALLMAVFIFWSVHYVFAFGLLLWIVIFIMGSLFFSKRAQYLSDRAATARSAVVGYIVDILGNIIAVKLFSAEQFESQRLKRQLDAYTAAGKRRDWYLLLMFAFQGLSFVIYQSLCMVWLITGVKYGYVSVGDFALILSINFSAVKILWNISEDIGKCTDVLGNIAQGLRIALLPIEIKDKAMASKLIVMRGQIDFEEVKFKYKDTEILFEKKSVTITPGQKVGLVGYSGSGKSTFVNLILRLFDIDAGAIKIDGQDIRDVTQDSLRDAIAIIPQDPSLFHRTLLENIHYGRLNANYAAIVEAAKKAHAHEFIIKLPAEYQTLVGERGVKLSGGQRQRIAIARAILKNAPILILDEATSQLDSVTEREIQESLSELMIGKTTIVIAHRLSTLLHMDRILVFKKGKIVEDGSHQELIKQAGLYKTMWDAQTDGFLPSEDQSFIN